MLVSRHYQTMKTFILLILSCASIYGADTGLQVTTRAKTNSLGEVQAVDFFTRDGQTNLVRLTVTQQGKITSQHDIFYHGGIRVGTFWSEADSSGFMTEADSPYCLIGKTWTGKGVSQAFICSADKVVVDYFNATNGQYYPVSSAELQHAQKMTSDMSKAVEDFPK